jgi:hypothetical protein
MTSNELTQYTLKVLNLSGYECWRNNNLAVKGRVFTGKKGVPDIIGFCRRTGKFIGVEIKVGKDRLSKEQTDFLNELQKSGIAHIVKTVEDADQILKNKN